LCYKICLFWNFEKKEHFSSVVQEPTIVNYSASAVKIYNATSI
jgi:hypothetical protein